MKNEIRGRGGPGSVTNYFFKVGRKMRSVGCLARYGPKLELSRSLKNMIVSPNLLFLIVTISHGFINVQNATQTAAANELFEH